MSVKLFLRATGDLPPGLPEEISSVFSSQEEATAQAVQGAIETEHPHRRAVIQGHVFR